MPSTLWTPEELKILIGNYRKGKTIKELVLLLPDRSFQAITGKITYLRLKGVKLPARPRGRKKTTDKQFTRTAIKSRPASGDRKCLRCREMFSPKWHSNYLCKSCTNTIASSGGTIGTI